MSFVDTAVALVEDAVSLFTGSPAGQWGLFLGFAPVITADSVVTMEYKQEWLVEDYPVEEGSFETYNKVAVPFEVRLRFSAGGSVANRTALLDSIAAIAGTTELFDAVTPEAIYESVNITHYDYQRSSNKGVGLIAVDVWCQQVIVTVTESFENTQSPSAEDPQDQGQVSTSDPDANSGVRNGRIVITPGSVT